MAYTEEQLNKITDAIVNCAFKVHKALGPGLLESCYEACLVYELRKSGLYVERQVPLALQYGDVIFEDAYRLDLLVNHAVVVELKSVKHLEPIHEAQLMTYLKVGGYPIGYLINFNEVLLKDGITRRRL